MQLMMYLGNDLIESVPVQAERLSQPGYLGQIKRVLKKKYSTLIGESMLAAEFLVINPVPVPVIQPGKQNAPGKY